MKRTIARVLGISLGIALGWVAAGQLPDVSATFAEDTHAATGKHAADPARDGTAHGPQGADAGQRAARQLVPGPQDAPFYGPMLWAVAALFILAVVLGLPALKLRGPDPPE